MKIASEGFPFFVPPLVIGLILLSFGFWIPAILFIIIGSFIVFFFRDPNRVIPQDENLILSPADGRILKIGPAPEVEKANGRTQMLSIFLSLFDVHINRSPMKGNIIYFKYIPGRFFPAFKQEASQLNERNIIEIENGKTTISLHQIAGVLARRVVLWKKEGDIVELGEKVGLMKFGSRADLFLPDNVQLRVAVGQRLKGGMSIIGEISEEKRKD